VETPLQEFTQLERGDFAEDWKTDWNGLWMKPTYIRNQFINSINLNWAISHKTFVDLSLQYAHHWTDLIQAEVRDTEVIPDEPWEDLNQNFTWDPGEPYTDLNENGQWNAGKYAYRIGIPGYFRYYDEAPWGRLPDVSSLPGNVRHLNWQDDSYTKMWTVKAGITSQIGSYNQIKAGFHLIHSHEHVFRVKPKNGGYFWYMDAKPLRVSGYIQDKLELGGIIANIGVRIDAFDPEDSYYDFNGYPFHPIWGNGGPGSPLFQTGQDSINRVASYSGGNLRAGVIPDSLMFDPPWQVTWSPRIGISHPISETAKIYFNYGHFYQPPRSLYLYALHQNADEDWKLREAGNPRLKMEKTVAWEIGYEHNLFDIFRIAVSGYYQRIDNERSPYRYQSVGNQVELYSSRNDRYRDVRGVDLKLEKRVGTFVTGWISYDLELHSSGQRGFTNEYQKGHNQYLADGGLYYSVPYDTSMVRRVPSNTSQTILPSRSRLRFNIGLHTPQNFGPDLLGVDLFGGWRANFLFQWTEGVKFTYNPQALPYVEENMQWKGYRRTDLKLSKRFQFNSIETIFYMEVYNLLNTKNFNMINYFGNPASEGGPSPEDQRVYYDSIIQHGYDPGDTDKPGIILPWGPQHALYFPKRDIYFGITMNMNL
jgi:hypothetical protein